MTTKRRALVERAQHPGYGTCYSCGRPWPCVTEHMTNYTSTAGCFPLCENCWGALQTPERRLPFYRMMYEHWLGELGSLSPPRREEHAKDLLARWPQIEAAVLAGD